MLGLGLVLLVCSLSAVFETAVGVHADAINGCDRNMYCKNQIHPGTGLSCCGGKAYNPTTATCCKKQDGLNVTAVVTEGLSEMVSACCGLIAYSPVNEICCDSTVVTKSVAFAQCCGREVYDVHEQRCCGQLGNRIVQRAESRDHQCCVHKQFNTTSQCCCGKNGSLEIHEKDHECCIKESATCGNKTYNRHTELCCQSTVVTKPSPNAQCCGKEAYDEHEQLCCGPLDNRTVLIRESRHHQCCGHKQFDTTSQCCCVKNGSLEILPKHHKCCIEETAVCGTKAYYKHTELCCQSTVVTKPSPNAQCCGKEAYDEHEQLCCGPLDNRTVLSRESRHHQCCGHKQFDTKTQCCCVTHISLDIHPKDHKCCVKESGVQPPTPGPQPTCTDPEKSICGSSCYNPKKFRCCEGKQPNRCCTTGQCDAAVYNPKTDVCCDGHVRKLQQDQGELGAPPMSFYTVNEDACAKCTEISAVIDIVNGNCLCKRIIYNNAVHHGSPEHCCGTQLYQPLNEICCDGHRHPRKKKMHCCGAKAYHIKDTHMKCCAGTLYNQTQLGNEAHCCGSILQKKQDVCCSHEDKKVPWSYKAGFRCCGYLYYNTSLWDCWAGKLIPAHRPGHHQTKTEEGLQSLNNLSEQELCKELKVGTVESVSLCGTMFSSILKVHGETGVVEVLPSPQILNASDQCNSPTLIPGKTYFFIGSNIFTDPNHDSVLQSIHFIFCKCGNCSQLVDMSPGVG